MAKKLSKKQQRQELLDLFSSAIVESSQKYGVDPNFVTKAQFEEFSELSEWDLRKLGGFSNLKKSLFPYEGDIDYASIRS